MTNYYRFSSNKPGFEFIPLPLQDIQEFSVRVSFLELYNEELFDLLSTGEDNSCKLRIFEDSARKVRCRVHILFYTHASICHVCVPLL